MDGTAFQSKLGKRPLQQKSTKVLGGDVGASASDRQQNTKSQRRGEDCEGLVGSERPSAEDGGPSVFGDDFDSVPSRLLNRLFFDWLLGDCLCSVFERTDDDAWSSGDPVQLLKCLSRLFGEHGIRATTVLAPHPALSLYRDSWDIAPADDASDARGSRQQTLADPDGSFRTFWSVLLGLHRHQESIDRVYAASVREAWCWLRTLELLLAQRPDADPNAPAWTNLLQSAASQCRQELERVLCSLAFAGKRVETKNGLKVASVESLHWKNLVHQSDELTETQKDRIYTVHGHVFAQNCTLSNVCWQQWNRTRWWRMGRIDYHPSTDPKYERFKVYLWQHSTASNSDFRSSFRIPTLMPCVPHLLTRGVEDTARGMVDFFWSLLWTHYHYRSTQSLRESLSPHLQAFFVSGFLPDGVRDHEIPSRISLVSNFAPTYPLSMYLHGPSGTGKSSLVRHFARALETTLTQHVDPAARVETVKQLLNKPLGTLELELELRRNNNDMSLSSILVSRRGGGLKGSDSEGPGLLVLALEELAPPCTEPTPSGTAVTSDLNQRDTVQLLYERLSGQASPHRSYSHVRTNGDQRRGVSEDTNLVTIFTSNYPLQDGGLETLRDLKMFKNLLCIYMMALDLEDRRIFAESFLHRDVEDLWSKHQGGGITSRPQNCTTLYPSDCGIGIDLTHLQLGSGDTRPLVRRLRMLAFYIHQLRVVSQQNHSSGVLFHVRIVQDDDDCFLFSGDKTWRLRRGLMNVLYCVDNPNAFDNRTALAMESLRKSSNRCDNELSALLDFWWMGSLAPLVILSSDSSNVPRLLTALRGIVGVPVMEGIDVSHYKLMRSLYDPPGTPNLRDDIRNLGKGVFVAIELICPDVESQLCIRELIEDTPSTVAFSSTSSALRKEGLLFLVHVKGDDITPELMSRASWIL